MWGCPTISGRAASVSTWFGRRGNLCEKQTAIPASCPGSSRSPGCALAAAPTRLQPPVGMGRVSLGHTSSPEEWSGVNDVKQNRVGAHEQGKRGYLGVCAFWHELLHTECLKRALSHTCSVWLSGLTSCFCCSSISACRTSLSAHLP